MRLPGRVTETHSDNPLTWDVLLAEAFGELKLHPWEFYNYSYEEYFLKRKGNLANELIEWQRCRLIAFYSSAPHMKKGFKIEDIFKLPGEEGKKITKKDIDNIRERYRQAGAL